MIKQFLNKRSINRKTKGFTLIEAMIAVVVFSFGLLGVAGVMIVSVKNNHNGYLRSQATILAHSIIESMRINQWSVWQNQYNVVSSGFADVTGMCTPAAACNATGVAARDVQLWSNMLVQSLPNGTGSIQCVQAAPIVNAQAWNSTTEPYVGICTVTVSWNESNETNANDTQSVIVRANP